MFISAIDKMSTHRQASNPPPADLTHREMSFRRRISVCTDTRGKILSVIALRFTFSRDFPRAVFPESLKGGAFYGNFQTHRIAFLKQRH